MIYLFHGTDREKSRAKWRAVKQAFAKKNPSGDVYNFDAENFAAEKLEELLSARGLFGDKVLVTLAGLAEDKEIFEKLVEHVPAMVESANVFVWWEEAVSAAVVKLVTASGGKVEECEATAKPKPSFNIFSLSDALGERDRKKLWVAYQGAQAAGIPAEEVFWKLLWQAKTMLLVATSPGPVASLKPFVQSKAARFGNNYKSGELADLSSRLVALWHESRREAGRDFAIGLERFILSI